MTEHRTWWKRNLELWLKFLRSSQSFSQIDEWRMWHFAWCHELCWRNLHTQEVFTKTRTFPRKHQWQYQERRFWNVPKVKKAFGDEMEILYRMSENESLIIMNPSWNCGKNVWNKKWTRKQRQGWWVARAKWNLSIYLFFFFLGGGMINLSYKLYARTDNLPNLL